MVDNIKDGALRNLTYLLGHDANNKGGKARPPFRHGPYTHKALLNLEKFKQGTLGRNFRLMLLFDSTSREDSTASPLNSQGVNGLDRQIAAMLVRRGYTAGANNNWGTQGTSSAANFKTKESRFDYTGAPAFSSDAVQGGQGITLVTTGDSISWIVADNVTNFDVRWRDSTNLGRTFSWQIDGGAATNVTTSGANGFAKTSITGLSQAAHTIKLTQVLGSPTIYGVDAWDATGGRTEITVHNWGSRGATTAAMLTNTGGVNSGRIAQATVEAPDLILAEAGIINDWNTSVALATSLANLQTIYDSYSAIAPILFVTPSFSDPTGPANAAIQDQYVQQMLDVADAKGTAVLDYRKILNSWAEANASGLYPADVHGTRYAYGYQANFIVNALGF